MEFMWSFERVPGFCFAVSATYNPRAAACGVTLGLGFGILSVGVLW